MSAEAHERRYRAIEAAYQELLDANPAWMARPSRIDYDFLMFQAGYNARGERLAEAEGRINELESDLSWDGLMAHLDRHYPPDLMANWPDDPGPRIVALIRQIHQLRGLSDGKEQL